MTVTRARGPAGGNHIAGFDGMRAISVALVIATHSGVLRWLEGAGVLNDVTLTAFQGYTGVQVFFVLSGFIITYLMIREQRATGRVRLKAFFIRRALRILPLYYLALAVTIMASLWISPIVSQESVLFAATFTTNFIPRAWYSTSLGHTWSLAVEEHFYLIWPLAVILLARYRWDRLLLWLLGACAGLTVLGALLLSSTYLVEHFRVLGWTPISGIHIAMGCAAAIFSTGPQYATARSRLLSPSRAAWVPVILFVLSLFLQQASELAGTLLRTVAIAHFVSWVFMHQSSRVVRMLSHPVLVYLGTISYGLYIWQGFFLSTGPYRASGQAWPPSPQVGVLLVLLVAPLSYHLFEKPILSLKARLVSGSRTGERTAGHNASGTTTTSARDAIDALPR